MTAISISALILTKNEEANIARCLKSLASFDDIVVVDSGSTDKTLEIVKTFSKVTVVQTPWKGFSETKNIGIKVAKHDIIFWIDADEEVSPELLIEMRNLSGPINNSVYSILRQNYFLGEKISYSGWQNDWVMRVFDRRHTKLDGKEVHEKLIFSGEEKKLRGKLHHYTFKNLTDYLQKIDHYTTLGAQERFQKGERADLVKLMIKPLGRVLRHYFWQRGFLDGVAGFAVSFFSAYSVFLRLLKTWLLEKKGQA
jgi:glycosyltransferase involved in cell wall biosynthesis